MVTKGDPSSCGDMKRVNEKGSVMSVTLAKPTVQVIACDVDERLFLIVGFANAMR